MTKEQKIAKEIFETVYQWGRVGLIVDSSAPTFQKLVRKLIREVLSEKN